MKHGIGILMTTIFVITIKLIVSKHFGLIIFIRFILSCLEERVSDKQLSPPFNITVTFFVTDNLFH